MDYAKEYPVAMKAIAEWIEKGSLKRKFHIVNGLDAAPSALTLLYSGGNTGKLYGMFAPARLVSHHASTGSSRFLTTNLYPSCKMWSCMQNVIYPPIYTVLVHRPASASRRAGGKRVGGPKESCSAKFHDETSTGHSLRFLWDNSITNEGRTDYKASTVNEGGS
jgi:hypothetical protein